MYIYLYIHMYTHTHVHMGKHFFRNYTHTHIHPPHKLIYIYIYIHIYSYIYIFVCVCVCVCVRVRVCVCVCYKNKICQRVLSIFKKVGQYTFFWHDHWVFLACNKKESWGYFNCLNSMKWLLHYIFSLSYFRNRKFPWNDSKRFFSLKRR